MGSEINEVQSDAIISTPPTLAVGDTHPNGALHKGEDINTDKEGRGDIMASEFTSMRVKKGFKCAGKRIMR